MACHRESAGYAFDECGGACRTAKPNTKRAFTCFSSGERRGCECDLFAIALDQQFNRFIEIRFDDRNGWHLSRLLFVH